MSTDNKIVIRGGGQLKKLRWLFQAGSVFRITCPGSTACIMKASAASCVCIDRAPRPLYAFSAESNAISLVSRTD